MRPVILALAFVALAACAGEPAPGVGQVTDDARGSRLDVADTGTTGCEIAKPPPPPKGKADEAWRLFREGEKFALGDGVPRDDAKAEKLFRRAIEADPSVGSTIAGLYDPVLSDRPRDMKKAIYWYERAAERGDGPSLDSLGDIYQYGKGVPIDLDKAFDYFSRAAAAGEVSGHTSLGIIYLYGKGRPVDYELARKHYLLAAGCGNEFAMHVLGRIHGMGLGTKENQSKALRWFAKAIHP